MKKNIATNRNRNYYIKLACLLLFSVQFSTLNTSALASSHADKEMLTILLQDKTLKEVDYVSCSPYRVPVARLAAAQAQIEQA